MLIRATGRPARHRTSMSRPSLTSECLQRHADGQTFSGIDVADPLARKRSPIAESGGGPNSLTMSFSASPRWQTPLPCVMVCNEV